MKDVTPHDRRGSSLIVGIVFLLLGGLLLAINLGYGIPRTLLEYWMYYPVVLIALGVLGVVSPTRHMRRAGAIWLLATGIYCFIGQFQPFEDLSWGNAWPIFIIAQGLVIMVPDRARPLDKGTPQGPA